MFTSEDHIKRCLELAKTASQKGEVPVGALIVNEKNEIISDAYNLVESTKDITAHAEILAIREASRKLGTKYLSGHTLYVTLEPCPMCAQAISNARIKRLVFGAFDEKSGGVENGARIFNLPSCHHKPEVISGICEDECGQIMTDFFKDLR